jgi:RNA polymerase sigma-70 factor (ECF subfamily)
MAERAADVDRLLCEARAGSAEAMGQVLEVFREYLLSIANQRLDPALRAKGGASDIVQETFLEAQRDLVQFAGTTETELKAWLVRLMVNNALNFARTYKSTGKRQVSREVGLPQNTPTGPAGGDLPGDTPTPSVEMMAEERTAALKRAIANLPEDHQRVIVLRNQEDRAFNEIAELMGRTENAVRKLWFRAVEQLQQEMDAMT